MGVKPLSPFDLSIAACLLIVLGLLSHRLKLGLEKQLSLSALRTTVQLLLIGQVLRILFANASLLFVCDHFHGYAGSCRPGSHGPSASSYTRYSRLVARHRFHVCLFFFCGLFRPCRDHCQRSLVYAPVCHSPAGYVAGQHHERYSFAWTG